MTTESRFRAKISISEETDCWNWTASLRPNGYAQFAFNGTIGYAHRFAYEHFIGPIPEGLEIDHLCRNRRCVNPAHLEAVTRRENQIRGDTLAAANIAKTHCPQGHRYHWRRNPDGSRRCNICARERARRVRAKQRAGSR